MSNDVKGLLREFAAVVLRNLVFPGRWKILRFVESILGKNPGTFVVRLRGGGKLIVDGVKDAPIFYLAEHDWNVRSFLIRTAKHGHTVVDCGANIGAYTIPLALRVGTTGHVYAFEAFRPNHEILLKNIALNGLTNVTPVFAAVTDTTGVCRVPEFAERPQTIGILGNYSLAMESATHTEIQSWSLDDFAREHGIDRINLMKLDIEGCETMAAKGARRLFREGKVDKVVCEFHPMWLPRMGSSMRELYELFESFGMKVQLLTRFSRMRPIDKEFCERASREFDAVIEPAPAF